MKWSDVWRQAVWPGALAGLAGGLVFGAAMSQLGTLPTIALLVQADSALVGFIVHMVIAAGIGAAFGVLVLHQRPGAGELLFWGLTYGMLWWAAGPLTLMPLLLTGALAWDVPAAQAAFPSLLGHLWYGATTGLTLVALRRTQHIQLATLQTAALARGALAGLLGAWLSGSLLQAQGQLPMFAQGAASIIGDDAHRLAWFAILLIGLLAGMGFALLFPRPTDGAGAGLIRGMLYGFFWWIAGVLTAVPLLAGAGLTWSVDAARAAFAALPGYLLFGAAMALLYWWMDALARLLFSDFVVDYGREGVGTRGLQAVGRGAVAGLIGGLLFTVVMLQVGLLPVVAGLLGSTSALTGFVVHLVIADLVGATYGLLFRHHSYDIGSGLGWGISYGFLWWILGPLTLMPLLLGATPRWTADVAGELFASLVGHLAYGAALGVTFHLLEKRYQPWWIPRTQAEAARVARRKEQVATSAPALWVLVVAIALTLPVVLGA